MTTAELLKKINDIGDYSLLNYPIIVNNHNGKGTFTIKSIEQAEAYIVGANMANEENGDV